MPQSIPTHNTIRAMQVALACAALIACWAGGSTAGAQTPASGSNAAGFYEGGAPSQVLRQPRASLNPLLRTDPSAPQLQALSGNVSSRREYSFASASQTRSQPAAGRVQSDAGGSSEGLDGFRRSNSPFNSIDGQPLPGENLRGVTDAFLQPQGAANQAPSLSGQRQPSSLRQPRASFELNRAPAASFLPMMPDDSMPQTEQGINEEIGAMEALPPALGESGNNTPSYGGRERITENYPSGKPKVIRDVFQDREGNYFNDGLWEVKNEAGQTIARGFYKLGAMDGEWQRIHDGTSGGLFATKPFNLFQSPFRSIARFKSDKLDGAWLILDAAGRKVFEINYVDGVRNGDAVWFYPNNLPMRRATFADGLLDGSIIEWDEDERVVRREEFRNGRRIIRNTTFYRPERKESESFYLDAKLEVDGEDDWWLAKPAGYIVVGEKVKNGATTTWYENGQPKTSIQYREGKMIGQFQVWHANGNRAVLGFFDEGDRSQRWTWWHENGMKACEGIYEEGEPVGKWRWWDRDGQLTKENDPSNGTTGDERDDAGDMNANNGVSNDSDPPKESPNNDSSEIENPTATGDEESLLGEMETLPPPTNQAEAKLEKPPGGEGSEPGGTVANETENQINEAADADAKRVSEPEDFEIPFINGPGESRAEGGESGESRAGPESRAVPSVPPVSSEPPIATSPAAGELPPGLTRPSGGG